MDPLTLTLIVLGIVIILILFWTYKVYNELTWHQIKVEKITGNLDAVLKNKFDLIPALIDVVKGYAKHESGTFTEVARLRSQWGESKNSTDRIKTANQLESALSKLLVVQERYPALKANRNFQSIQKSIYYAEGRVLNERKYYNEVVRRYNVRIRLFPKNIIAKTFKFEEKPFYSMEK